jgi:regulatory protein
MSNNFDFTESERAYITKAEQYCAANEQCRSAVRDKLMTWGADRELTERITEYLVDQSFIDEERYCRIYCDSKLHLQKWGRLKIAYQLRSKRIDNATIEKALSNIDEEQYSVILQSLAETKSRTLKDEDIRKRRNKLSSYLSSHGFTIGEIESAVRAIYDPQ